MKNNTSPDTLPALKENNIKYKSIRFGRFRLPYKFIHSGVEISVVKTKNRITYIRKGLDENIEKIILTDSDSILVNPIEPVNKPKHLTPYLMIEFEKPVLVEPKTQKRVYIKFPIEIGIFITKGKSSELVDIFTFSKQKFTLYGEVRNGDLCRYWKSTVYSEPPKTKYSIEGVNELVISNPTSKWITLTKVVMNAYGMQLYFDNELVAMRTKMKLMSELVAETEVSLKPFKPGMTRAIELFTTLRPPILHKKYVMECCL